MKRKIGNKLLYTLLITTLLTSVGIGATGTYGFTKNTGYIHSEDGIPINNIQVNLSCNWNNGNDAKVNTTFTDFNGFYSFANVQGDYTNDTVNNTMYCSVHSPNTSVTESGVFSVEIQNEFKEVGEPYNFTYEHYNGTGCFNLSSVKGYLKSLDDLRIKDLRLNLTCDNTLINSTITDGSGFYNFTGLRTYSCNDSNGDCSADCSITGVNEPIRPYDFTVNVSGINRTCSNPIQANELIFLNQSVTNLTYDSQAGVNVTFYPPNGTYGNMTRNGLNPIEITASPLNLSHGVYNCTYSINQSLSYLQGTHFPGSPSNNTYLLKITDYNTTTFYVACKTNYTNNAFGDEIVKYEFDLTPPKLNITNPKEDIIYDPGTNFNVTLNEPSKSCYYNLTNTSSSNLTFQPMQNLSNNEYGIFHNFTSDGFKNLTINCTDVYNNMNVTALNFNISVDFTPPVKTNVSYADYTNAGNIIVAWDGVSDAFEYYVYEGLNGVTSFNPNNPHAVVSNSSTQWVRRDVDLSKWYYYRVAAVDAAGNIAELSDVAGPVKPESIDEAQETNQELREELENYEDEEKQEERAIEMMAQVDANVTSLLTEFNTISNLSRLLSPELNQDIQIIRQKLMQAESEEYLSNKKAYYKAALSWIKYFPSYDTGESSKHFTETINGLRVDTNEDLLHASVNNESYNKFFVERKLTNADNRTLENISLRFPLPNDAVLVTDLPTNSPSIVYNISRLEPGESEEFNYTYYTYTNFVNDELNGTVMEVIPPEPPKPITGYVGGVLKETERSELSTGYNTLTWTLVIIMSLLYWKKETVMNFLK